MAAYSQATAESRRGRRCSSRVSASVLPSRRGGEYSRVCCVFLYTAQGLGLKDVAQRYLETSGVLTHPDPSCVARAKKLLTPVEPTAASSATGTSATGSGVSGSGVSGSGSGSHGGEGTASELHSSDVGGSKDNSESSSDTPPDSDDDVDLARGTDGAGHGVGASSGGHRLYDDVSLTTPFPYWNYYCAKPGPHPVCPRYATRYWGHEHASTGKRPHLLSIRKHSSVDLGVL